MDELNLAEIENKINSIFAAGRRIVFWYDDNASFAEQVDGLHLPDVTILHLTDSNAFRTKLRIEMEQPEDRFLLYAPFKKPDVDRNHLEDTLRYSVVFHADRLSLIAADLKLPERLYFALKQIAPYFGIGSKVPEGSIKRTNAFIERAAEIDLDSASEEVVYLIAMCALTDARKVTSDELMYAVLTHGRLDEEGIIDSFEDYGLNRHFWNMAKERYGYYDPQPTLLKFAKSLFVTSAFREQTDQIPAKWDQYKLSRISNVNILLDNMMNNVLYQEAYDDISNDLASLLDVDDELQKLQIEKMVNMTVFSIPDHCILHWMIERLLDEDADALLAGMSIPELCEYRKRLHFGKTFLHEYNAVEAAYRLLDAAHYEACGTLKELAERYISGDYGFDTEYRRFIVSLDRMIDTVDFELLQEKIENIYQTEYLEKLLYAWNEAFMENGGKKVLPFERSFYQDKVATSKNKVAVIISDALRYEAAMELLNKLSDHQNLTVKGEAMMAALPSVTAVGMASLLPHEKLSMKEDYTVMVDGRTCGSKPEREQILIAANPKSCANTFKEIRGHMTSAELKAMTSGQEVIYIYHNTIDITGEGGPSEDKVFDGVETAIREIYDMITKLYQRGNVYYFIVTADHGFIYTRRKVEESSKLDNLADKRDFKDRRFLITKKDLSTDGVFQISLGESFGSDDGRHIMLPKGYSVFKAGGGMNYVHGGSSPQEMIIPCIFVHAQKGTVAAEDAQLILVSNINKVTNLMVNVDFLQENPVGDLVRAAKYKIRFETEDRDLISNEIVFIAESKAEDPRERMFTLHFDIKRQSYDQDKKYYLRVMKSIKDKNEELAMERQVIIDLPFTGDFGFSRIEG